MAVFGLWLFGTNPDRRRLLILACLAGLLSCVVIVAWRQRSLGGCRSVSEVARAACARAVDEMPDSTLETASLPRVLPSRRGQQLRGLAWVVGIATALLGILALALGAPQRSERVERMHAAGAEFGLATAEKISDVRRKSSRGKDPYTATVVVRLPGAEPVSSVVRPTTNQALRPGDKVSVLYAPSQPRLGAVAGDERSLGAELRGQTMPAYLGWLFVGAWALSCLGAVSHVSATFGFRAYSRLGHRDRAVRGRCVRIAVRFSASGREPMGGPACLEIQTDAGVARFHTNSGRRGIPDVMEGWPLWLCWDALRGARASRFSPSRTPAALVFDNGLVLHGMMKVEEGRALDVGGVSMGKRDTTLQADRPLRLFDVRSQWLLYVEPLMLQTCAVVIACTALLTFEVPDVLRWTAGIVAVSGVWAVSGFFVDDDASRKRGTKE
ncbi:hypothetical protein K6168_29070 [Streptomyces sp. FB2]|uniref:hypothetical protein n=1 Tax=Streptomyces sp. FB2 TaxID=2902454 RepID=UPI001F3C433E|nr:hypothetical protein [Streptomyces sp. FB2]MCF2539693.1 hypothetical protein [Streptomyces sp. FB2]